MVTISCDEGDVTGEASGGVAIDAHGAKAATDMGGYHHPVSLLDVDDGAADFFDDAERLMADDSPFDAPHASFVEVKVGAADRGRGEAEQNVGRFAHLRIRNFANRDPARFFEHDGFHGRAPYR